MNFYPHNYQDYAIRYIETHPVAAVLLDEKYAFRCFLLRLGFIGNEYKAERKILLKNLSGNSSWKNGAPEKEVAACE